MIALNLENPELLAEAFYLSLTSVKQFDGKLGTKTWRRMKDKQRQLWIAAAKRVIALYTIEGLTVGALENKSA